MRAAFTIPADMTASGWRAEKSLLFKFHAENLKRARPGGRAHLGLVAFGFTDESARDRRADGDFAIFRLRLMVAHYLVHHLIPVFVNERDRRAEDHLFARQLGDLDHLRARHFVLDLTDLDIEQRLDRKSTRLNSSHVSESRMP